MKSIFTGKQIIAVLSLILFLFGGISLVHAGGKYKEGEILVKFKPGVDKEKKEKAHKAMGANKIKEFENLGLHQLKLKKGMSVESAIKGYAGNSLVEYAEPNFLFSTGQHPVDPYYLMQWGFHNVLPFSIDRDMDAPEAWDAATGSRRVVVAVIDTGIDYNHKDLAANMWINEVEKTGAAGVDDDGNGYVDDIYGIDTFNNDANPYDDNNHGTHVAGTIGAVGNNGIGVAGVNWNVQLMACKFLNSQGQGWTTDAIECLEYVRKMKDRGVPIVATNNSWGGGGYSQALFEAINAQSDILFVAAAGNSATNNDLAPLYPSSYTLPSVLSVAASDNNDNLAYFSNYGLRSVDIAAPGYSIISTIPGNGYAFYSGTSMATPHVTGLAALIKSVDESMAVADVKDLILRSGDAMPKKGFTATDLRINAANALSVLFPEPGNLPPTADAGSDQSIDEGLLVLLDGSNSGDPDDGIASYRWTQVQGPAVAISNQDAARASFYAPEIGLQEELLSFKLTVTDFGGMQSSDTVDVFVQDTARQNTPPVAEAGANQSLTDQDGSGRERVSLDGTGSYDPDGTITSLTWKEGALILGQGERLDVDMTVGTHVVTLTVTDDMGAVHTDTVTVNIAKAPPRETMRVFVNNIAMSAKARKGRRIWQAKAIVEVRDLNGAPVGGATVYGIWTNKFTRKVVGTTFSKGKNRKGKVDFTAPAQAGGGTYTFTVTRILVGGKTYDPSLNKETKDSITVR